MGCVLAKSHLGARTHLDALHGNSHFGAYLRQVSEPEQLSEKLKLLLDKLKILPTRLDNICGLKHHNTKK